MQLTELGLDSDEFEDGDLKNLTNLRSLKFVGFRKSLISAHSMKLMPKLKHISLSSNPMGPGIMELTQINSLSLAGGDTSFKPEYLRSLTNLTEA